MIKVTTCPKQFRVVQGKPLDYTTPTAKPKSKNVQSLTKMVPCTYGTPHKFTTVTTVTTVTKPTQNNVEKVHKDTSNKDDSENEM